MTAPRKEAMTGDGQDDGAETTVIHVERNFGFKVPGAR